MKYHGSDPKFDECIAKEPSSVLRLLASLAYYSGIHAKLDDVDVPLTEQERIKKLVREFEDRRCAA